MTNGDLTGKVAIVTGAGQGVGEATAHALAKRGATLVLTDINADRLAGTANEVGGEVQPITVAADLTVPAGPELIVSQAIERAGQVDMLASVAGHASRGTILDTTVDQWDQMHHLNVRAHFQLIQGVARHLVERGAPGSIACAGSLNAFGGQPDLCAYSAAKGGLLTLARHAAHALLPHRVRVNIVNFDGCTHRARSRSKPRPTATMKRGSTRPPATFPSVGSSNPPRLPTCSPTC